MNQSKNGPLAFTGHTIPSCIEQSVSLKQKNWFKTGGNARFFAAPNTNASLLDALTFAKNNNLAIHILGSGANVLISEEGFDGLIICPAFKHMNVTHQEGDRVFVNVGAGVSLPDLITFCLDNGCLGLEEFSGIPGTVGGSVYINLHYFEFLLAQFLVSAQVIDLETHAIMDVDNAWFAFGYNTSRLHEKKHLLLNATFTLRKGTALEVAFARGREKEIIRHRQQRYPRSHTCGSFFRNFHEHEVKLTSNGKKMIYIAYYLDNIGVKGQLSYGDAIVSYQHANMLVNRGNATSNDIIMLARTMQELVRNHFGIVPQPECQLIGFKEYPLLKV